MKPFSTKVLNILFILILLSCNSSIKNIEHEFTGKVIGVKDGDTVEVLYNGEKITIRLADIDCPELKNSQPFGKAAKKFTSDLCFGKLVKVVNEGKFDKYKRLIATIYVDNEKNLNKEIIIAGMGWWFEKYSKDSTYYNLQKVSQNEKVGLWSDNYPTPPWEWRKK